MKILGISAFFHDSAACLLVDGKVAAAAQEERFTRIKGDEQFPVKAIEFCLQKAGISLDEIDALVFYEKPFLKFERVLESFYYSSPRAFGQFLKGFPSWSKEKLFLKKNIAKQLKKHLGFNAKNLRILFSEHHLSHAASAFYPSNFDEATIITIDGVGEWTTTGIFHGKDRRLKKIAEQRFPHSLGLLYSAFTQFLGFKVNEGEYKMMGLAPYGNPNSESFKKLEEKAKKLYQITKDGGLLLNLSFFNFLKKDSTIHTKNWENLFGLKTRLPQESITQTHCDFALVAQQITEIVLLQLTKKAVDITGCKNLCLAGGVALNCVANGKILRSGLVEKIYIQPASNDAGSALGAALVAQELYFEEPSQFAVNELPFYGQSFDRTAILHAIKKSGLTYKEYAQSELIHQTAKLIQEDQIIGWFQDSTEFGPRALGNRSILGNPQSPTAQKKVNLKIKNRESFRPFAPIVLEEDVMDYFDIDHPSPHMLIVAPVQEKIRKTLPNDYDAQPVFERVNVIRSKFPAITHVDFSARIQTVNKQNHPLMHELLSVVKKITGHGMLINTSFNIAGEPIVNTPQEAIHCFKNTNLDVLVLVPFLIVKE